MGRRACFAMNEKEEITKNTENETSSIEDGAKIEANESSVSAETNAVVETHPKKEKKTWSKKKNIIFWSVGGTLSLAVGISAGVILGIVFNGGATGDYSGVDVSKYAIDYDGLLSKYNSMSSTSDYSKEMTACDMANTALYIFYNHDKWESQGYGKTSFNVMGISGDQEIRSTFIRDGSNFFEESLSKSSIVQAAWRMYEDHSKGNESVVERYKGVVNKDVYDSKFDTSTKTQYTRDEYYNYAGRYLDGIPCIYIISDKCLATDDQKTTSGIPTSVTKNSAGYTIEIELDPNITVKNYVLQMQTTADLAGAPYFKFVHLTLQTDLKLNLISMTNYEAYYAKTTAGAGSNMTAKVTTYFSYGDDISIPSIDTQTTYDTSKE